MKQNLLGVDRCHSFREIANFRCPIIDASLLDYSNSNIIPHMGVSRYHGRIVRTVTGNGV